MASGVRILVCRPLYETGATESVASPCWSSRTVKGRIEIANALAWQICQHA